MVNAKVKKGSYIAIIGNPDIEEYTNSQTKAKGINHNINVYDWEYVSIGKKSDSDDTEQDDNADDAGGGFSSTENCGPNGLPFN